MRFVLWQNANSKEASLRQDYVAPTYNKRYYYLIECSLRLSTSSYSELKSLCDFEGVMYSGYESKIIIELVKSRLNYIERYSHDGAKCPYENTKNMRIGVLAGLNSIKAISVKKL